MSMMPMPLPSRCAAMPSTPPIVTMPVPPTAVTMIEKGRVISGRAGSGNTGMSAGASTPLPASSCIDAEKLLDGCLVPRLFEDLALRRHRGVLGTLDASAGQGPPRAPMLVPMGQEDLTLTDDHAIGGDADVHPDTLPAATRRRRVA